MTATCLDRLRDPFGFSDLLNLDLALAPEDLP